MKASSREKEDCRCYSWFLSFIGPTRAILVKSSHPVTRRHVEWQKERTGVIRGSEYIAKSNGEMYRSFEFMKQEKRTSSSVHKDEKHGKRQKKRTDAIRETNAPLSRIKDTV